MRRTIIIAGTALAVLAAASAAFAAGGLNTYRASIRFSSTKAGSARAPVPVGFTENYTAANATSGNRAAPLVDIKTSIYGLVSNGKDFPACNGNKISALKTDSFCPPKALVATGPVNALLGNPTLSTAGSPCNPFLHVWNGGQGRLWFFFTTSPTHYCLGLPTGSTAAYPGFISQHGKFMVTDVPLPPDVSTMVAHQPNFYGSLIKQVLTFRNVTTKVHGKTVGVTASVGCQGSKRPYKVSFTAVLGSQRQTVSVSGSAPCHK